MKYYSYSLGFVALMLMILVALGCGKEKDKGNVPTLSKLHVAGNKILDELGSAVRLRGVSFADPYLLDTDPVWGRHFKDVGNDMARVKAMSANVVRATLYPGYFRLVGGSSYLNTYVDPLVDLAKKNGLYIILSYQAIGRPGGWYDTSADTPTVKGAVSSTSDQAVAFWNAVASRYSSNSHVLFEIWNEPADLSTSFTYTMWRPTGQLLIDTVRSTGASNIILASSIKFTGDLTEVPTNPFSDGNLVYVTHMYPGNVAAGLDQPTEWNRLFGFLASTYPVIVSEWGYEPVTTNPDVLGTSTGYGSPLIDYLDSKNLSWVAFIFGPPDMDPRMLTAWGGALTDFGSFVQGRLGR